MDAVDDTVGYQDRLTENFYQFSRYLVAEDYVDSLVESEVLSIDDRELILNRFTNPTRRQRAVKFIEVLMTRGPAGYKKFLELLEYQCPHVYETVAKKRPRKPPPDFQRNRDSDRLRLINELPNLAQHIKDQFTHEVELSNQLSFFQQLLELSKDEKTELESEIEGLKKVEQENYSLRSRITDLQNEIYEQQSAMNNVMQRYLNCMEERDKAKEKCHVLQLKNDELYKQTGSVEGCEPAASPLKRSISEKSRPSTVPPKPMPPVKPKSKLDVHQQKQEHVQARQNIIADELEMYKGQCEDIARQLDHTDTELNRTEDLYNRCQNELSRLKETSGILERQVKEAKAKHETDYKTIQDKCKDITGLHMERLKEATRLTEITRENTEMRQHVHELEMENEKLKWQLERSNLERTNLQNTHSGTGSQGSPVQANVAAEDKRIYHKPLCRLVSPMSNPHRAGVFGGCEPSLGAPDVDRDRDSQYKANALPNTGTETTESIFRREVVNFRYSNKLADSIASNASMTVQSSFKVKDGPRRPKALTFDGPTNRAQKDDDFEDYGPPPSKAREPVSHPPDSEEANSDGEDAVFVPRQSGASLRPRNRGAQSPDTDRSDSTCSSRDTCMSRDFSSHDVYTLLLPLDPVPVSPGYPKMLLQHVTVKFPILEEKLEICGGNHTGIFLSKVNSKSLNLHVGDEIREITYNPNKGEPVRVELLGATLEDTIRLLSSEFIRPKKEKEIKLGISKNSHAYKFAQNWMVKNNDTGDYVFIRCNLAIDCEEISLKPGDIFLMMNSCYDEKHWSGYKVQPNTGERTQDIQVFPNLQRANYSRLSNAGSARQRGFRLKGATYERVLPMKASAKLPIMLVGPKDIVNAMVKFIVAKDANLFMATNSDDEATDHANLNVYRQDCHILEHGKLDRMMSNKHIQKIVIFLHVTAVPSERDIRSMFGCDYGVPVSETTVGDCQILGQRLPDIGHSFEEICIPAVNTQEALWEKFISCVCDSQDRFLWLSSSEMDVCIADGYKKFLGNGCDLAQIGSFLQRQQSIDDS